MSEEDYTYLMEKKITIEKLAKMTQDEFRAVHTEMHEMKTEMREMKGVLGEVLEVVKSTHEMMADVRTIRRIDLPELDNRIESLEHDMIKVKEKVKI